MTVYPNSLDTILTLPTVAGSTPEDIAINALQSAVIAIETELGINPKGIYSDVVARLSIIEGRISSGGGMIGFTYNVGTDSAVVGLTSIASGEQSFATGLNTTASGPQSFAAGNTTIASGDFSFAAGYHCQATNQGAFAGGFACFAQGQAAVCIGFSSFAEKAVAVAIGDGLDSAGVGSCTLTEDNSALADHSTALGEASIAEMYGMYAYASQGHTTPYADQYVQVIGQGAASAVNLLLGDSTEIVVPNGRSAFITIEITAVSTTSTDCAGAQYNGLINTEGGTLTITDMTQMYIKNTPGYIFTISAPSGRTLRINCNPGSDTVNFIAAVRFRAMTTIA